MAMSRTRSTQAESSSQTTSMCTRSGDAPPGSTVVMNANSTNTDAHAPTIVDEWPKLV